MKSLLVLLMPSSWEMSLFLLLVCITVTAVAQTIRLLVVHGRKPICDALLSIQRRGSTGRIGFIRAYALPPMARTWLKQCHPALTDANCLEVEASLRQFFIACVLSGGRRLAMPSRVTDDLWQGFHLQPEYAGFCRQAFGHPLLCLPTEENPQPVADLAPLQRCWEFACEAAEVSATFPWSLPLLFAIDGKLGITNGCHYRLPNATAQYLVQPSSPGPVIGSVSVAIFTTALLARQQFQDRKRFPV